MNTFLSFAMAILAAFGPPLDSTHKKPKPNSEDTQKVLTVLLASSEEEIPEASTCNGRFGQTGRARMKDLLAMELASLSGGSNSVAGTCASETSCALRISHAFGEAVSSANIRFKVKTGRVDMESLSCVLTP